MASYLQIENISKSYGPKVLFEHAERHREDLPAADPRRQGQVRQRREDPVPQGHPHRFPGAGVCLRPRKEHLPADHGRFHRMDGTSGPGPSVGVRAPGAAAPDAVLPHGLGKADEGPLRRRSQAGGAYPDARVRGRFLHHGRAHEPPGHRRHRPCSWSRTTAISWTACAIR